MNDKPLKTLEECYRRDGENIIVMQSWLNQLPLLLQAVALTFVLLYFTISYPEWSTLPLTFGDGRDFRLPYLVIFPLFLFGLAAFRVGNARLVLCPEYLIFVSGIFTWNQKSIRLEYRKIQEIEIDQAIPQRFHELGDVIVTPAFLPMDNTICIQGVRHPGILKDSLRARSHISEGQAAKRASQASEAASV